MADPSENEEFEFRARAEREAGVSTQAQQPSFLDSLLHKLASGVGNVSGAPEAALHYATGAVGGLGGGLGYLGTLAATGGDTGAAKTVQEGIGDTLTYQPRSEGGNTLVNAISGPLGALGNARQGLVDTRREGPNTVSVGGKQYSPTALSRGGVYAPTTSGETPQQSDKMATGLDVASQAAPLVAGLRAGAATQEFSAAQGARGAMLDAAKAATQATTPIDIAETAGFRVRPSDVMDRTNAGAAPSLAARATQDLAGSRSTQIDALRHNKPVWNSIAAQDIGLPSGTELNPANLAKAEAPFSNNYNLITQNIPTVQVDGQFTRDVMGAGRGTDSTLRLPAAIDKDRADVLVPMNGAQMRATISDLRDKGWADFNSDRSATQAVGNARLELANALEGRLDRAVADNAPNLSGLYQQSRTGFAKVQAIRRSLTPNGVDIDPQKLVRAAGKTNAMDGGLKIIADVATAFPKVMQLNIPEEASGPMHTAVAVGTLGVAPLARMAARKALSATRGEATNPVLGLGNGSRLSDYYTRAPGADAMQWGNPQQALSPDYREGGGGYSFQNAPQEILNPDYGGGGGGYVGNARQPGALIEAMNPDYNTENTGYRSTGPAGYLPPIKSTVTIARQKEILDHLVQALQSRGMQ